MLAPMHCCGCALLLVAFQLTPAKVQAKVAVTTANIAMWFKDAQVTSQTVFEPSFIQHLQEPDCAGRSLCSLLPSRLFTCEVLDARAAAAPVLKAHGVANLTPQLTPPLLSNTPRHCHGTLMQQQHNTPAQHSTAQHGTADTER